MTVVLLVDIGMTGVITDYRYFDQLQFECTNGLYYDNRKLNHCLAIRFI